MLEPVREGYFAPGPDSAGRVPGVLAGRLGALPDEPDADSELPAPTYK